MTLLQLLSHGVNWVLVSSAEHHRLPRADHALAVALSVLRHSIVTNFTAEGEGVKLDRIIADLLKSVPTK